MEPMDEIVTEFLAESRDNLAQLDQDLVALEREPGNRELLSRSFRTVHTIKGTCGFLAFGTLESVTHVGENLLSRLRDGEMALTPQLTTLLLEMVDVVRSLLASIEQSGSEGDGDHRALTARLQAVLDGANAQAAIAQTSGRLVGDGCEVPGAGAAETSQSSPTEGVGDSIGVDADLLDGLVNLVGELVLTRNQLIRLLQTATCQETEPLTPEAAGQLSEREALKQIFQAGMVGNLPSSVVATSTDGADAEVSALLVLELSDGRRVALPLSAVDRLEQFPLHRLERVGGHEVVRYRGEIVPLVRLDHVLQSRGEQTDADPVSVVVCQHRDRPVGFVVARIHDIVECGVEVRTHLDTGGHHGSVVVDGYVTELLDVDRAASTIDPELLAPALLFS